MSAPLVHNICWSLTRNSLSSKEAGPRAAGDTLYIPNSLEIPLVIAGEWYSDFARRQTDTALNEGSPFIGLALVRAFIKTFFRRFPVFPNFCVLDNKLEFAAGTTDPRTVLE